MKKEKPESQEKCGIKDYTLCLLGVMIVTGFFFINWLVLTGAIIPDNATNVTTVLNYTNSLVIFVAGYFFGASKASGDKDRTIQDMATASMTPTPVTPLATTTKTDPDGTVVVETKPVATPLDLTTPVEVVNAEGTTLKTEPETDPKKE